LSPTTSLTVIDMFALWHLLLGVCITTPITTALVVARRANVGMVGYALAFSSGLAVGAFFGWTMWASHWIVGNKITRSAPAKQEWYARAFYFTKLVWIVLAACVGLWFSKLVLRVVFNI
jgi:hypothetical protein